MDKVVARTRLIITFVLSLPVLLNIVHTSGEKMWIADSMQDLYLFNAAGGPISET
jgi:hypothetical protein